MATSDSVEEWGAAAAVLPIIDIRAFGQQLMANDLPSLAVTVTNSDRVKVPVETLLRERGPRLHQLALDLVERATPR